MWYYKKIDKKIKIAVSELDFNHLSSYGAEAEEKTKLPWFCLQHCLVFSFNTFFWFFPQHFFGLAFNTLSVRSFAPVSTF